MTLRASLSVLLVACSSWTAQDTATAVDVGKNILCAIEHAELDDAALNAVCGALTPDAKSALAVHRAEVARAVQARGACKPAADGGAP